MMELIVPLVILAITGLTFVAYRHHDAYKILYIVISIIAFAVMIALGAYDFGISMAATEVNGQGISVSEANHIEEAIESRGIKMGFVILIYAFCNLYLTFLAFMPALGLSWGSGPKA